MISETKLPFSPLKESQTLSAVLQSRGNDLRLVIPAALVWTESAAVLGFGVELGLWLLMGCLAILVGILVVRRQAVLLGPMLFCALCIGIAFLGARWQSENRYYPEVEALVSEVQNGQFSIEIIGYCTQRSGPYESGTICPIRAELIANTAPIEQSEAQRGAFRSRASFSNTLISTSTNTGGGSTVSLDIGARLQVIARAQRNTDPGPEPYRLRVREILQVRDANGLNAWLNPIRDALVYEAALLPGSGAELLPGVSLGNTELVSKSLDEAMKTTSLSHLTAVSGSNFGMVVMTVLFLAGATGISRLARSVFALCGLGIFFVLVTAEPSVLRAAVMAIIVIIAQNLGRRGAAPSALAASVLILLIIDPWLSLEFGFILSVSATAGLIFLAPTLASFLEKFLPSGLALVLSIPLAAQLCCQPALLLLQDGIPSYGVLANLLVALASPLATGLGLLAGIFLVLIPPLGLLLLWLAWLPSTWIAMIAEGLSAFPFARLVWFEGSLGAILWLILGILAASLLFSRSYSLKKQLLVPAVVVTAALISGIFGNQLGARQIPSDWQIAFCDIGQGDAIVIRSAEQIALIDTGPDPVLLSECLGRLGITRLDLLVISHFDQDHIGGLAALAETEIALLLYSAIDDQDAEPLSVLQRAPARYLADSRFRGTLGNNHWRVLWPLAGERVIDRNQSSLVVSFQGEVSLLSLADLGEISQLRLLGTDKIRSHQIVKVAHHGSADQFSGLYKEAAAEIAVFTVGKNTFGHPNPKALALFEDAVILRTDEMGLILLNIVSSVEEHPRVKVWTER
ncbi:MAG: ComEC/Rec2 family competence protein [Microbacteriaceae bacterium]